MIIEYDETKYKLVPIVPSQEMIYEAGRNIIRNGAEGTQAEVQSDVYIGWNTMLTYVKPADLDIQKFKETPVAWLFPEIGLTTTHEDERDRWLAAGRQVSSLYAKVEYE